MTDSPLFELSFRQDIAIVERNENSILFSPPEGGGIYFNRLTPGLHLMFDRLFAGGVTEAELSQAVMATDGPSGLVRFYQQIHLLGKQATLNHTVRVGDSRWASIKPMVRHYQFKPKMVQPDRAYQLSRFACARVENEEWVLETPTGYARVVLHSEAALPLLQSLTRPFTHHALSQHHADLDSEAICFFMNLLLNAKLLVEVTEDGATAESTEPSLAQWNFYDLLFHSRSRKGRHNLPYGGTFRFIDTFAQLPVVKIELPDGEIIPLAKPDIEALKQNDVSFTAVLEERKSIRNYAEEPITAVELGHFLYRSARIKQQMDNGHNQFSLRPYPGGGALYELELYLIVNECDGIAPGVYYYNPAEHQLHTISTELDLYAKGVLEIAWHAANKQSYPQVYIGITSRFQRLQWKYDAVAYALTLKNVGTLYQTMYLVATALGLAPCALGGGDSDLFGNAAKLDNYYAESLVGEFLIGSQGDDPGRALI